MNLEEWRVGGGGLGGILVFVVMGGEMYRRFWFVGGRGWGYGKGGGGVYVLIYIRL